MDVSTFAAEGTDAAGRGPEAVTVGAQSAISRRIGELEQQDLSELRAEWRRLFRTEPPQLSRDLILRAVAHRLQERAHGGHSKATLRRLANLVRELRTDGQVVVETGLQIRPGARLVREWRGRTHSISITENGFEYAGATYASLSAIAQTITGAHWSGPRFFGLVRRRARTGGHEPEPAPSARLDPRMASFSPKEAFHG